MHSSTASHHISRPAQGIMQHTGFQPQTPKNQQNGKNMISKVPKTHIPGMVSIQAMAIRCNAWVPTGIVSFWAWFNPVIANGQTSDSTVTELGKIQCHVRYRSPKIVWRSTHLYFVFQFLKFGFKRLHKKIYFSALANLACKGETNCNLHKCFFLKPMLPVRRLTAGSNNQMSK